MLGIEVDDGVVLVDSYGRTVPADTKMIEACTKGTSLQRKAPRNQLLRMITSKVKGMQNTHSMMSEILRLITKRLLEDLQNKNMSC
ncbi:hypothetical protein CEXT_766031 [Caerostris extrusa]|uniref:Uncharacterized protein n=1 Tax=Caerostris extrusa TaxID=172846 RepID=A0AAV4N7N7_CAEEX|nr:hypothetical protein CEXT_766031 [Caerostris extrusa]